MSFRWGEGKSYEDYVGRWSRLVALEFVKWLEVPTRSRWVDVGCGTGALTETILELADPREVVGIDPAEGFVEFARETVADDRARFTVGDAQDLPLAANGFESVVSGLVLNFVPDQARAVAEFARVSRAWCAAYVWDYAGEMQMMRHFWDAAVELDPGAAELDEGRRFETSPQHLEALFRSAGLERVETRAIDVPTAFSDFDDYWTPFLSGQAPAPEYAASLGEEARMRLRELVRGRLPIAADGSIRLTARAWAVRGHK